MLTLNQFAIAIAVAAVVSPLRLVISIDGTRVQLVDELGRATNLVADGKKQDRVTGDGEFKSTTKLERGKLVVEEDLKAAAVAARTQGRRSRASTMRA